MEKLCVILCFFIVITCSSICATYYPSCFPHERDVLLAFKNEYDDYMDSDIAKHYKESWRGFNCCDYFVPIEAHRAFGLALQFFQWPSTQRTFWPPEIEISRSQLQQF
ncbi:hypothetical protein SUGI_0348630 [Cryptomeria japonica]|nr:hypothetical protein SUGI_0348630 [Cryptomeria japonica]